MSRAAYEIRVVGSVPRRIVDDFDGVSVFPEPAGATLRADRADQAQLHGLLDALRRDGVVLVDVRREPVEDSADGGRLPDDPQGRGGPA